ncbi:hypothetical protein NSQ80_08205 [Paenibacillus sp. FSL K6-2441]
MATSDAAGNCDVSPRGDEAGFVLVLDDQHLVIPERPGTNGLTLWTIFWKTRRLG